MDSPRARVECGVTYWSSDVGPYVWHEFDAARATADIRRMSSAGFRMIRTLLPWDAFMPTPRGVEPARLRDLERFLAAAAAESVQVVPVMFVQSFGDCVMLPAYAIDVDRPRRGVRVLSGGVAQPGGPRDVYTEPRMLDAGFRWLEQMLTAFAGHSSIAAWDLGHDPASTVRPRRIAHLRDWVAALAALVHERGQRCTLTFGVDDAVTARGVRMGIVASDLDGVGMDLDLARVPVADDPLDAAATRFVAQLTQRLAGEQSALEAHVGVSSVVPGDSSGGLARYAGDAFSGLVAVGCAGVHAAQWANCGARVIDAPPVDRAGGLCHRGVVDTSGEATPFGAPWMSNARTEHERRPLSPWPAHLDIESYYANLPDSLRDLYAAWSREVDDRPAMLD